MKIHTISAVTITAITYYISLRENLHFFILKMGVIYIKFCRSPSVTQIGITLLAVKYSARFEFSAKSYIRNH